MGKLTRKVFFVLFLGALWLYLQVSISTFIAADGEMFQRAGSLGVAAGILVFAAMRSGMSSGMQIRDRLETLQAVTIKLNEMSMGPKRHLTDDQKEAFYDIFLKQLDGMRKIYDDYQPGIERYLHMIGAFELVIIAIATMQWGYGDMLINRFRDCGDWKC